MKEQLQLLVKLQKTETEVAALRAKKDELPRKKEMLVADMEGREQELQAEKDRLESLREDHRRKEAELADGAERIKKAKNRLLDVKTNKEYEATLKEIDSIVDANGIIEDGIITLLDEIDRTRSTVAASSSEIEEYRRQYEKEAAGIEAELGSIDDSLEEKVREQKGLRSKIDEGLIKKFDLIRGRRNGQAVVKVENEVCSGCHMNIPPQLYNELLRSEELILCPHCNRIIYCEDDQKQ